MPRSVLVTGASSGIGRAVAVRLSDDGHSVLGLARDFEKFPGETPNLRKVSIDLAEIERLPGKLESLARENSDVDAIVFSAGRGRFGGLEEFSYEQIRSLMDLNFLGQAYVARAFLPAMKRQGRGDLVFVGSEAALAGKRKGAVYCAGKFALRGFAQALREECSSSGVRVCIINPGSVRTAFFDELDFSPGDDPQNYILPEDIAELIAAVLAGRPETVYDEINLSPLKKVLRFRKGKKK